MSNSPTSHNDQQQQPSSLQQHLNATNSVIQQQQMSPNTAAASMTALEHYRLSQLYQYALAAERFRCAPTNSGSGSSTNGSFPSSAMSVFRPEVAAAAAAAAAVPFLYNNPYYRLDPRLALYRPPEEPKPQHSYIGLIAMAILSHAEKKLVLSDIYQYILDNYAYFRARGPGWRNSIRHNLSLNDCFVKAGRSANGKGHYWAIHPANLEDFQKGDFRRRKAQRKVRRHMGLAVDDEDSPSPPPNSPPPLSLLGGPTTLSWPDHHHHPQFIPHPTALQHHPGLAGIGFGPIVSPNSTDFSMYNTGRVGKHLISDNSVSGHGNNCDQRFPRIVSNTCTPIFNAFGRNRKRQFDVASLLAPEMKETLQVSPSSSRNSEQLEQDDHCSGSPAEKAYNKSSSSPSSTCHIQSDDDEGDNEEEIVDHEDDEKNKVDESVVISHSLSTSTSLNITVDHRTNSTASKITPASSLIRKRRHHRRRHESHSSSVNSSANYKPSACDQSKGQSNAGIHCNSRAVNSNSINNAFNASDQLLDFPFSLANNEQLFFNTNNNGGPGSSSSHFNHHTNQMFFQQNPSLASLMILSSRYRELTSSLQQQQQPGAIKKS